MVNEKRTPIDYGTTAAQVDNIMLLELALVNLGQPEHHRRSELVRVNIDTGCFSYLSSIGVEKYAADGRKSTDIRLWPDRLRTVRFQFRINATAAAGRSLEMPCTGMYVFAGG